ncbi:hypothetical protein Trco_000117 [Trichoderma cornu-damae]|uniref:Uncharacterized protein n=1 Tax=Trichoderma cornu-damae TaxID=654480 RepID=A0A9P8QWQ5_9HYPO|nr:hypothetical protein Trco_000117 [Trichoderma cornu-damae]
MKNTPPPFNSDRGFVEPSRDARGGVNARVTATATGLSPIPQHDNGGGDILGSDLAGDARYDHWSPNPTSAPSWFPSAPSPGLLFSNEWGAAPASLMGYGAANMNSEYEAQLPWPEPDTFHPYANMMTGSFDDDADPFGTTYYTPRGIDGILDPVRDPEMALQPIANGGGATPSGAVEQHMFEGQPSVIPFRVVDRMDVPVQPALTIMPAREEEEEEEEEELQPPVLALAQMPTSMMLQPRSQTLKMPSPLSVISPPSSVKSPARKRNVSAAGFEKSPAAPKKRVIKPHMTTKVDNSEDFEIKKDSEKSPSGTYQGYFHTFDVAKKKLQRLLEMYRKPKENCSFPSTDNTFPKCDGDKMGYIKDLFDAINDWSNFREWSQALKTDDRNRIIDRLRRRVSGGDDAGPDKLGDISLDDMRPSQQELESILPPLEMQQKKILGRLLSDQTVEWLCWELIEAAVQSQQGITQIPHWCGADGA